LTSGPTPAGGLTPIRPFARRCQRAPCLLIVLAAVVGFGADVRLPAETASAPTLKAAFLYNFVKFATWPPDVLPAGAPLQLCVVDDPQVAKALEEAAAGRDADGHSMKVVRIDINGPVRTCHLLYAQGLDPHRATQLGTALKGAPVLSVGDIRLFTRVGGMIQLFVQEGRMRFAVNIDETSRSKLKLSSQMLGMAVIVKDDTDGISP
jgi:hypothetical protein